MALSPGETSEGLSPPFLELLRAEPLGQLTVLDVGTGTGRLALALGPLCRAVVGVDREVATFESVEQALAAAVALREQWKADGRWVRYVKFLEEGGRTLTRARLVVKARKK